MVTLEKIKSEFTHIKNLNGTSEVYHDSAFFEGVSNFCDVYFNTKDKQIKQEQVDKYNQFRKNYKSILPEIEKYIMNSLKKNEENIRDLISKSPLKVDVIEIPFDNVKYDLVLVCGKTFKKHFFNRNIDIRVEFKNGEIKTIQRKTDTTTDNE